MPRYAKIGTYTTRFASSWKPRPTEFTLPVCAGMTGDESGILRRGAEFSAPRLVVGVWCFGIGLQVRTGKRPRNDGAEERSRAFPTGMAASGDDWRLQIAPTGLCVSLKWFGGRQVRDAEDSVPYGIVRIIEMVRRGTGAGRRGRRPLRRKTLNMVRRDARRATTWGRPYMLLLHYRFT